MVGKTMNRLSSFNLLYKFLVFLVPCLVIAFGSFAGATEIKVGMRELPATSSHGSIAVFYPTQQPEKDVTRDALTLRLSPDASIARGNGHLILISHGSAANPWVSADLARALVLAGFVVAIPEHKGDNTRDFSKAGPDSWKQRPIEISKALDAIAQDAEFGRVVDSRRVGIYGGSAGGHTVLTLAGGQWSPARFAAHCQANIKDDFAACAGFTTRLSGGWLDGPKQWLIQKVLNYRFSDSQLVGYKDPRIAAAVAEVPYVADFDTATLRQPRMPLGVVLAGKDTMLNPRFHGNALRALCIECEVLADLPLAGHGVMLSPMPPLGPDGSHLKELLGDPPGFDRSVVVPEVHRKIASFFVKHLVRNTGK